MGRTEPPAPAADPAFDNAACALVTLDASARVCRVNRTFCRHFGYTAEDVLGTSMLRFLTPGGRIFSQTHWFPLMQIQGSVAELKLDLIAHSGERIPTLVNAVRHDDAGRAIDHVAIFIVSDRHRYERSLRESREETEKALAVTRQMHTSQLQAETRLTALNERLVEADRFKDAFLATLAHELRNPISAVGNITSLLSKLAIDYPKLTRITGILDRQLIHMTRLVDDLLDAARIGQGKIELKRKALDLNDVVAQVLETSLPAVESAGHRLAFERCTTPLPLHADAMRIGQIVQNLLNNAIKYTPRGGVLRVRTAEHDNAAVLEVIDNGIGIAPDQRSRIFDMFAQLDAGNSLAKGGLGIGLALIRGLVELHGGTIAVESQGVRMGSKFSVKLPLSHAAEPFG